MIKETRYIIRRVIIGFLIAILIMFFKSVVFAETLISSGTLGYYDNTTDRTRTIYQGSGMWTNQGRGYLTFNIVIYTRHTNTSMMTPILRQVKATSGGKDFICELGSTNLDYQDDGETFVGNVYTVVCDMEMGSTGLNKLETLVDPAPTNAYWLVTSQLATFDTNLEIDIANRVTAGVSIINGKMDAVISAINQTRIDLANTINADASLILQAIQNQGTQAHQDAQAQKEATDNINDSINDSSTDNPSSSLNDMNSKISDNNVISDLLTLPIRFYQTILNSVNSSCTPYNLGRLFNTDIVLPCKNIEDLLGSGIVTIIDTGLCGLFIFTIRKKFVNIFENITSLRDRGNELE